MNKQLLGSRIMQMHMKNGIPLIQLGIGDVGKITGIHGGEHMRKKLIQMGLIQGSKVELINSIPHGPLVLRVDETKIIIGWGMAKRVFVQPDM